MLDNLIVCALSDGGFTAIERTIMGGGESERVLEMRRDFQRVMKVRYSEMIEELTGRRVLAFLSQAHVAPDLTIEMFLVDARLAGFGAIELVDPGERLIAPSPRTRAGSVLRPFLAGIRLCIHQRLTAWAIRGDHEAYFSWLSVRMARVRGGCVGCVGTFWMEQALSRCPRPRIGPTRPLRSAHTSAANGSTAGRQLAPRPEFSAQSPDVTDGAVLRHEATGGGYWFLTAGPARLDDRDADENTIGQRVGERVDL